MVTFGLVACGVVLGYMLRIWQEWGDEPPGRDTIVTCRHGYVASCPECHHG